MAQRANSCGLQWPFYDFGDYWEHRVKVEKSLPPTGATLPVCIAGANAAPPDDCGGVAGYAEFVQAMADPGHPEHASMKEWFGDEWDPRAFDIDRVNAWLIEPGDYGPLLPTSAERHGTQAQFGDEHTGIRKRSILHAADYTPRARATPA